MVCQTGTKKFENPWFGENVKDQKITLFLRKTNFASLVLIEFGKKAQLSNIASSLNWLQN